MLHFLIVIYLCGILGFVCDDYFVPSLEIIADSEYDNVYFLTVDPLGELCKLRIHLVKFLNVQLAKLAYTSLEKI